MTDTAVYIILGVMIISIFVASYLVSKTFKERKRYQEKDIRLRTKEEALEKAEQQVNERIAKIRVEIEEERLLARQQTTKEMEAIKAEYRENTLREVASEAEREYVRQVALMSEEKDKYVLYLNQELEEDSQSFLESINTLRFMERKIASEVEDVASRLVSLIEAEKSLLDESRQKTLMLPLSREDIADLRLLMEDILPRIRREDVIRKLIWAEYIQKPTFTLVSDVFPMGTPGIYKITNTKTKKSYVGRSVDTRARVVEHIKSSLGLGSISDQAIHHAMREEGLENFMFELLEDCEKDKLAEREKYYIGIFQSDTHGYNKNKGG